MNKSQRVPENARCCSSQINASMTSLMLHFSSFIPFLINIAVQSAPSIREYMRLLLFYRKMGTHSKYVFSKGNGGRAKGPLLPHLLQRDVFRDGSICVLGNNKILMTCQIEGVYYI